MVTSLFENGFEKIVGKHKAFINFDGESLKSEIMTLITPNKLVIEVLETVVADVETTQRVELLKNKGYTIALDEFNKKYQECPLIQMAKIVKFDLIATPLEQIKESVAKALEDGKILLAEKVEDQISFEDAKAMGFYLFQGYFFCRPDPIGNPQSGHTTKTQYIRLLSELDNEEPSYQKLAEIIETDVNMAYKLLRVIDNRNSDTLIYSIKKALTFIGLKEMKQWIHILLLQDLCLNKPNELMRTFLIRSKFAEVIANQSQYRHIKFEAALMGLFSTLDAILDASMVDALKYIPLPVTIKNVLTKAESELKPLYDLIMDYEAGQWPHVEAHINQMRLNPYDLVMAYRQSVEWTNSIMQLM